MDSASSPSPGDRPYPARVGEHRHVLPHGLATRVRLAGLEPPPRDWKDNNGQPIIFDGIDVSDSLLGKGPGERELMIYSTTINSARFA